MAGKYNQTVTYWQKTGDDGSGGSTYAAPVPITARWQDTQVILKGAYGEELTSQSTVYTQQEIEEESYLFLGTSAEASPLSVIGAHRVLKKGFSTNLKATKTIYKVWL